MNELIALLREIRPNYSDVGSRDVDTTRRQKQIDRAIELLSARKPDVVQYQARLRDPILPECEAWINITEAGAISIRAKHSDVYEVRELVERGVAPQVGREAQLAKHLREQAQIFRQEDSLARGAKELEEAASLLESGTSNTVRVLTELREWIDQLQNLYPENVSWDSGWRMACQRMVAYIYSITPDGDTTKKEELTDPEIRRMNSEGLEAVRAMGIESFSIDWWPAFTRYIIENAPRLAAAPAPTHAELAAAAIQACSCRTGADGWIFENTDQLRQFLNATAK